MAKKKIIEDKSKKSNPMGRPTIYKSEYCLELIKHMADGFSFEAFGAIAHCCKDTLYEWLKKHPEFADAKRLAESYGRYFWEKAGQDGMTCTDGERFNATVWVFNMKNRFGWRDSKDVDIKVEDKSTSQGKRELDRLIEEGLVVIHQRPNEIRN